jgi:hypothetical protein
MAVFLGPQGTFVMGTKAKPVTEAQNQRRLMCICLNEMRHVYFTCISAQLVFVTGIKQQQLPRLVTGHVKWLFLWAHMELW